MKTKTLVLAEDEVELISEALQQYARKCIRLSDIAVARTQTVGSSGLVALAYVEVANTLNGVRQRLENQTWIHPTTPTV